MKMPHTIKVLSITAMLAGLMVAPASAYDYTISGVEQTEFYQSTNYEDVYGGVYQYGGTNISDFIQPALPYGTSSNTYTGVMDKPHSGGLVSVGSTSVPGGSIIPSVVPTVPGVSATPPSWITQFTPVSDVLKSNGTLGTISIPSLGITANVKPDETMSYSVGHISSTSAWNGNVGICGHNRGSSVVIGDIKALDLGDTITYKTDLGTRTYAVTVVTKISNTDWSHLTATTDNRITLITCVENNSDLRWMVQAVEI